ncbi:hypothetical protein Q3G72_013052 [Acer saccharum]|nr:hypothetical protein Q3G72_013052 [Acer saccharum]
MLSISNQIVAQDHPKLDEVRSLFMLWKGGHDGLLCVWFWFEDDYGKNGGYDIGCKVQSDYGDETKMVEMKVEDGDTCEEMAKNGDRWCSPSSVAGDSHRNATMALIPPGVVGS